MILEISNLENDLWVENEKYILDCYNEEKQDFLRSPVSLLEALNHDYKVQC